MEKEHDPNYVQARDEALRAIAQGCGLNAEQISVLLLHQLHLATNTLRIEPTDFSGPDSPFVQRATVDLDADIRQALISWLVLRPDGANNHLFPGEELDGLSPQVIQKVLSSIKTSTSKKGRTSDVDSSRAPKTKMTSPAADEETADKKQESSETTGAVSLEEIQSLREQLASVEGDWTSPVAGERRRRPSPPPQSRPERPVGARTGPARAASPQKSAGKERDSASGEGERDRPKTSEPSRRVPSDAPESMHRPIRAPETVKREPAPSVEGRTTEEPVSFPLPPKVLLAAGAALIVVCCIAALIAGGLLVGGSDVGQLVAGVFPLSGGDVDQTALTDEVVSAMATEEAAATDTPIATEAPTETPAPTLTPEPASPEPAVAEPTAELPTWTPVIVVVTATSTPEATATPTRPATNTPAAAAAPTSPAVDTPTPTPSFRYAAPELLEPDDGSVVPGRLAFLKWESVGPLADNEWYALRLVFLEQGQPVYNGDRLKTTDWRVPERFYYQADGPALQYEWYVFVEQDNPDGSSTQISPESQHYFFRWE